MIQNSGQKLNYWWIFLTVVFALCAGCGSDKRDASSDLSIQIQIPEGEQPELFWYGVESRILTIKKEGMDPLEIDWLAGKSAALDLDAGDKVKLVGLDRQKRVLVEGEAEVTKEKKVSIPVHRVL